MTKPGDATPNDIKHLSMLWAGPEHAAELATLHAGLFEEAWDAASFQKLLAHPGATALDGARRRTAADGGLYSGPARSRRGRDPDRRRSAKPCSATASAAGWWKAWSRAAKKAEARQLFLEVGSGNAAALALYKRMGFQEAGVRKGYYVRAGRPAEDAIRLALAL